MDNTPQSKSIYLKIINILGLACSGLGALLLTACAQYSEPVSVADVIPSGQLSNDVVPTHYRLELSIQPDQSGFTGHVEIKVDINQATDHIWLHGNQLDVSSVTVVSDDVVQGSYQQITPFGLSKVTLPTTIEPGSATLIFDYTAPFNTNLEGLYKVTENGLNYAFTQFEPTAARLVFPGFDDPKFKVPFDISLTVAQQHTAITSTPVVKETILDNARKQLDYATTKPMPTYLVAFAVGEFDVVEWPSIAASALREQTIPLRGITVKGKGEQIRFALQYTAEMVLGLERYFGIGYPYKKLDIIAVPDFNAGAMENVGAITYREQLLLMDETAPVRQQRYYFIVHAHELAHQWFGNLVTPVWWDDIWLNEAFATWMSYQVLHQLYPDQGYQSELLNRSFDVMSSDSLASARQIREPVDDHRDISSAFDGITYRKGGGVLSMFANYVGEEGFRQGIQHYMKKYAWGNTTAEDFIGAIAEANPQVANIESAFMSFLQQPGIPFLKIESHCENVGVSLAVSQQRYAPLGSQADTGKQWQVPACFGYVTEGEYQSHCTVLAEPSSTIKLPTTSCPSLLMPNQNGRGYYRWSLSTEGWQQLLAGIATLDNNEQMAAANSLSAAFHAGDINLSDYMASLPPLVKTGYWRAVTIALNDMKHTLNVLLNTEQASQLAKRLAPLFEARLMVEQSGPRTADSILFINNLTEFLAFDIKHPESRQQLVNAAQRLVVNGKLQTGAADQNLLPLYLRIGVDEIGRDWVELLNSTLKESDNALLRGYLLAALAYSTDPGVIAQARALILSPAIRDNELYPIISSQLSRRENRNGMGLWLQQHFDQVLARRPATSKGRTAGYFKAYCSFEQRDRMAAFLPSKVNHLEGGPKALAQTLEQIELCATLRERTQL